MLNLSFVEWLVMTLATFRLVRLVLFDEITSRWRSYFLEMEDEQVFIIGNGWRYAVGYLLTCHWCAGIWCGAFVIGATWLWPWTFLLWIMLSLAGASSLLHVWVVEK
jgi:hypothetical protein